MWLLKLLVRSAGPDAIDLRDYLRPLIVDVRLKGLVYFDGVAFQPTVVLVNSASEDVTVMVRSIRFKFDAYHY